MAVRLPADATGVATDPELMQTQSAGGTVFLEKDFGTLGPGDTFALRLDYTRASDALAASQADLQPSQPLDGSTQGRVMLTNYYPYILGALGIVLVAGGALSYRFQSARSPGTNVTARRERLGATTMYTAISAALRWPGDRFCVCGTKLRLPA
jgi:hypothetical protein